MRDVARVRAPLFWLLHALHLRAPDTQMTGEERACLARHAAGRTTLVEIGVMHGASTRLLSEAMAPEGLLVAIDPFPPGRLGVSFEFAIARREVARGPQRRVVWLRQRSEEAVTAWRAPIDLLFIDGDHSWSGIDHDWSAWSRFVACDGVVALHDSHPVAGRPLLDSVRYTQEVILRDPRFTLIDRAGSLTVLRRMQGARP
jgi:predicted O-methyltransferase YrrM